MTASVGFWHILGILCAIFFAMFVRLLYESIQGKGMATITLSVLAGVVFGGLGILAAALTLWLIQTICGVALIEVLDKIVLIYLSAVVTFAFCWILGKAGGKLLKNFLPRDAVFQSSMLTGIYMTLQPIGIQWMDMLGLL